MRMRHLVHAYLIVLLSAGVVGAADAPLPAAAGRGDLATVRALLAQGADVNATGVDGTTALHWAAHADRDDMVEVLLKAGATATAPDRYGVTPLYLACVNGNAATIRRLLDAGADPNAVDPAGETALMTAACTVRMTAESVGGVRPATRHRRSISEVSRWCGDR